MYLYTKVKSKNGGKFTCENIDFKAKDLNKSTYLELSKQSDIYSFQSQ